MPALIYTISVNVYTDVWRHRHVWMCWICFSTFLPFLKSVSILMKSAFHGLNVYQINHSSESVSRTETEAVDASETWYSCTLGLFSSWLQPKQPWGLCKAVLTPVKTAFLPLLALELQPSLLLFKWDSILLSELRWDDQRDLRFRGALNPRKV